MKILLDTSVLVAALVGQHPRHARSLACLLEARRQREGLWVSAHSLAELYAVLTRFPVRPPITPGVARRLVQENLLRGAHVIDLEAADYGAVGDRMADHALTGGAVYDALIVQAALKAGVDRLRTWNAADFRRVWPDAGARLDVLV